MGNYDLATKPNATKKPNDISCFDLTIIDKPITNKDVLVSLQNSSSIEKHILTSITLHEQCYGTIRTIQQATPVVKFNRLKTSWESETAYLSSITDMATHPAYQQIIGMGYDAVPLILHEMEKKPNYWFWALISITGEDPVTPEHKGDVEEMTDAWLSWGRNQGYLDG